MKKLILISSLIELIIIVILGINVYKNKDNILGTKVSINPIRKDNLIFPEAGKLKYFYEPKPDNIASNKQAWLPDGYDYVTTINADSLNERFDYSPEKPQDVFRITTLGDSYTFGLYVNTKENFPERLEDLLNNSLHCPNIKKFEVINLGVGGYDIEYSVQRFKTRGQKYNPDLVLWFIKDDDFRVINELILPEMRQYKEEIRSNQSLLDEFRSKGKFHPWASKAVKELVTDIGEEGVLSYSKKALEGIGDLYKGRLVFISFSGVRALKSSRLNILQNFVQGRNDTYFYDGLNSNYDHFEDGHPNSKGYEQIASEIFNYIISNHLIPCD